MPSPEVTSTHWMGRAAPPPGSGPASSRPTRGRGGRLAASYDLEGIPSHMICGTPRFLDFNVQDDPFKDLQGEGAWNSVDPFWDLQSKLTKMGPNLI